MEKQPAIFFSNVNYKRNDLHILKNINGEIPSGKITTLVGPSGAGKTTLFKLMNGLISPISGDIYVDGKHINDYQPVQLRHNIALALQQATMINGTVEMNIALPMVLQNKSLPKEKAEHLLELVGLDGSYLSRQVKDLSGGQRQKLSIARTLVNKPKTLLLDEITSSLDRVSKRDIENLIQKINKELYTTIVWITHNLDQARTIGDYTWVMMNGELVEQGDSTLLDHPKSELVKQFIRGDES
ncbi:phosphate ABC transporter ATP-binding protein [Virgibacillus soli]|uniref:Phosphate ABC transporter ATP-binding protein n=1 Tax=Paracerasibacillus soli TaxID=480284 RepID=A0ABU5CNR8_9BACI|nr:phosphate ABC transporter ATP-binding protein [Virgibacillus soli]MDY0408003.1 phosphate ABC transporter ATP-binding protein [Virgibacillus soli]